MKNIIVMLLAMVALCACQKEEFEGYDMPFVRITTTTGASQTVVLSNVNNINTYVVSLSSKALTAPLTVNYEVVVGDGLLGQQQLRVQRCRRPHHAEFRIL